MKCKHRKTWLMCGATWEWCYACGAVRQMGQSQKPGETFCYPITLWQLPVGPVAENPWPMTPNAAFIRERSTAQNDS